MATIPVRKFKVGDEVIIRDMGGLKAKVIMIDIPRTPVGLDVWRPAEPTWTGGPNQAYFLGEPMIGVEVEVMVQRWYDGGEVPGLRPTGETRIMGILVPEQACMPAPCPTCHRPR